MGSAVPTVSQDSTYIRRAHHAGSWYESDADRLREQLNTFLAGTASSSSSYSSSPLRAAIVPHAGYAYSGRTAAYAYNAIQQELQRGSCAAGCIRQILILHPSHHVYMPNQCAVSNARILQTPLGDLTVDAELRRELVETTGCTLLAKDVDEQEHSGELQYPFLAHVLQLVNNNNNTAAITVTPVMCGSIRDDDNDEEARWGRAFAEIVNRPHVLTLVSTDFCHWGRRFGYQPTPKPPIPIHEWIRTLDQRGMDAICTKRPRVFGDYLKQTANTICGRHAVSLWMRAACSDEAAAEHLSVQFVRYDQSSQVTAMNESSVSYAVALVRKDSCGDL